MNDLLMLAYSHASMFDDMVRSLSRGVVYAGAFRMMHALPLAGAVLLVLAVLAIAWAAGRR